MMSLVTKSPTFTLVMLLLVMSWFFLTQVLSLLFYFFKDFDASFFDVDKDVSYQTELVRKVDMPVEEMPDLA